MAADDSLSYEQFRDLSEKLNFQDEEGSGFSVKAFGPNAGELAKDSFMVADREHEQFIPVPSHPEDIMTFAESKQEPLHDDDAYVGAWVSHGSERGTLDVSRAIPRSTPGARALAFMRATRNRQDGFGEIDADGEYVGTHPTMGLIPWRHMSSYKDVVLGRPHPSSG